MRIAQMLPLLFSALLSVNTFGYGDRGYPYTEFDDCREICVEDSYKLCKNNCTSYVAYILNKYYGVSFHNTDYRLGHGDRWGHGKDWDNATGRIVGSSNIPVDNNLIPGDVAYWNSYYPGDPYGHVAWVEKVYYDSNGTATHIDVTEFNINKCSFGQRINVLASNPSGYIHILAYEEGVSSLYYTNCYEMSGLCDYQTPQQWEWIIARVARYRCKDCEDNGYKTYADGFYDGSGFGGAGTGPQPILGPRVDLRPDFDVYDLDGHEVSANCDNRMGKSLNVGQTIRPKLWVQVSNEDAGNFKRNSNSDTIEGPVWWMIEGVTGWNLLGSGEYTIGKLDEGASISETHTWAVPSYPGNILAMRACVDGDDEIYEESESSGSGHDIDNPDQNGTTNNCSRRERFYINHPNYIPTGAIEGGDCIRIQGWAKDDNATSPLQITVVDSGSQTIDPFLANGYRDDLGGNFGINWVVPDSLKDGNQHTLTFYATNVPTGTNPGIGSIALTCSPPAPPSREEDSAVWLILQQ